MGDVTLKVVSAVVDRPRVLRSSGRPARPQDPYLVLRLQLENLRDAHKLDYTTWASPQMRALGVRLTDNLGNTYDPKTFSGGTIEGQLGPDASLYPHEPVTEVLVFERPVESPQLRYLRLELPAMAFGDSGRFRIEIPAEMIQRAPEPAPETEPPAGERPSEPEPPEMPGEDPAAEPPGPMPGDDGPDITRDYPELFPELHDGSTPPAGEGSQAETPEQPNLPRLVPKPDQRRGQDTERPGDPFDERPPLGGAL